MQNPMIRMNTEISGQPQEMAIGPPLFQAWPNVVKQPARIEMIENEMAKLEKPLHLRRAPACSRARRAAGRRRRRPLGLGWRCHGTSSWDGEGGWYPVRRHVEEPAQAGIVETRAPGPTCRPPPRVVESTAASRRSSPWWTVNQSVQVTLDASQVQSHLGQQPRSFGSRSRPWRAVRPDPGRSRPPRRCHRARTRGRCCRTVGSR